MRDTWRRRVRGGLAVLLLGTVTTGATTLAAGAADAAARTGQVYVVHGLVGLTVDVDVDGKEVAREARPKTVVGPLDLAAGEHVVTLTDGDETVATAKFDVPAGGSIDVVAHRMSDAERKPTVTVFRNNLAPVGPGKSRVVVSHTAVAPPADIRIDGKPFFRNVAARESLSLVVPAKTYSVDVVPSSGGGQILAPVSLTVRAGTLTRVFAIGDPSEGTADAIVQVLPVRTVGAPPPSSVPSGDGGQAADRVVGVAAGLGSAGGAAGLGIPVAVLLAGLGLLAFSSTGRGAGRDLHPFRSRHAR